MTKENLPFGTWPGAVSAAALSETANIPEAEWCPGGRVLVWLEERSGQGILYASHLDGKDPRRITGDHSVRAGLGYGGGNFAVARDAVYYVEKSGRLFSQPLDGGAPQPLTPEGITCASPAPSPDGRWIVCVFEEGTSAGLAIISAEADAAGGAKPVKIAQGLDFYMQPTWHPVGNRLAWVGWNHPNMPWDGARLYTVPMTPTPDGPRPGGKPEIIAGGEGEAVIQPQYAPDGSALAFISDREGWFQIYCQEEGGPGKDTIRRLTGEAAEFGGCAWQQGMRWYGWLPDGSALIAARNRPGSVDLVRVERESGQVTALDVSGGEYTTLTRPAVNPADGRIAVLAAGEKTPHRLVVIESAAEEEGRSVSPPPMVIRRTAAESVDGEDLARIEPISWQIPSGEEVHGLFAAPASSKFSGEGLPPLVVNIHGGPTSQAYRSWRPDLQFFTSRGYAFLDVNHRGSSGYGRAYREKLRGQWGVYDAEDALSGLEYVSGRGWADGKRAVIKGGSAGGYTVLRVLTLYPDAFRAAVCLYGISDLFALARETHKFEAHYTDTLIGPLPKAAELYRERSPLFSADRIRAPVIIFQGAEDRVVPPEQSERIVASLKRRGIPHQYHLFPEEGHGFRKTETVRAWLDAMERFLLTHLVNS